MKRLRTFAAKPADLDPKWRLVDAGGQTLGRMASRIAITLQGKDKAIYTPHQLTGDFVVVINASKVVVTGRKLTQKLYYRHSGYTGNLKSTMLRDMLAHHPDRVIRLAVKGMLPDTKRGRDMLRRLKIYGGDSHPHQGQLAHTSKEE